MPRRYRETYIKEQARKEADSQVARLTAIFDAAPMAMVMTDASGRILLVNNYAERLFGYRRDELLGQAVEVLVPERFRVSHPEKRRGFFAAPESRSMGAGRDLYALRKDGSEFPVEIGLNPLDTADGQRVISTIIDITDRKRLEDRFRAAVESAPLAMLMVDAGGRIVLVNADTENLFGYGREELLGKPMEMLVPERFRSRHPAHRRSFFRSPEARRMGAGRDLFGLRKDGSEFPVEIGLNPIHAGDDLLVLSAIIDITERKRLEAALHRANEELEQRVAQRTVELERAIEALEKSNIELQHFAYVASHDLQSPLRSISGFVQLLKSEYKGQLDRRADDWIDRTVQGIRSMQTLINDLLAYSRIESASRRRQKVSLNRIVQDAVSMLDAVLEETDGRITCDELPTVTADRSQLVQLMQNLIGNGLKYRGEDPPVVHVSAERGEGQWVVAVRDNGMGIDPKYHERVFEIFRRLHNQKEYPGTGIGLAVCRRVITGHGGRIWLDSTPGKGSTFYFTIPDTRSDDDEHRARRRASRRDIAG